MSIFFLLFVHFYGSPKPLMPNDCLAEPLTSYYYVFESYRPKNAANKRDVAYFRQHYAAAQSAERQTGIPASVTLAQAKIESAAGSSRLAQKANNHFGVKCFNRGCASGHCIKAKEGMFRRYKNAAESFTHRAKVLQKPRYVACTGLTANAFCDCLQEKGYATDKNYAKLLKAVIKQYKLSEFDAKNLVYSPPD